MKFCPSCGAKKLREQDRFCMNCGEPYPVLADAQQPAATAAPEAVEPAFEAAPAAEAAAPQAETLAPAAEPAVPESLFEAPAPVPGQAAPAGAANVQPSKLAASAESARAASAAAQPPVQQPAAPATVAAPVSPAPQAPAQPTFTEPVVPQAPAAPVPPAPSAPVQTAPPAPRQDFAPAGPAAREVEAEAASLRDSIDKMLGGETPVANEAPAAQPQNLFDPGVVDTTEPAVPAEQPAPWEENLFEEGAAPAQAQVFDYDAEMQYDEYGNPLETVAGEDLFVQPAEGYGQEQAFAGRGFEDATLADDGLGFEANNASLFDDGQGGGEGEGESLFPSAPTPRQQYKEEAHHNGETPRRQRYEDLNRAVESAAGPENDKWQRLQQDDDLQSLYAREQRKQKPPEVPLPEYDERRSKKSKSRGGGGGAGRTVGIIVTAVIVFIVGTLGATLGLLYYRNSPGKAIDALLEAVEDRNYNSLNSMTELEGVEGTTDGWAAFCDAFESASAKRDLQNQLKSQAKKGATATDDYPAVVMESEPLFLFVKRYYVSVQGIDLLAEGIHQADSTINGLFMKGEDSDNGLIFRGMMPGRYTYELHTPDDVITGEIDAFTTEGANKLVANEGAGENHESATVTVGNCKSDDATLYVAGSPVDAKPSGGVVTLENVPLGSEIRIEANVDGNTEEARVVFSDINETSLAFGEYTAQGNAPSEDDSSKADPDSSEEEKENEALARAQAMGASDINGVLETFYRSYLTSINDQTTDTLKNSTSANTSAMAARITADSNAANTFEFLAVNTDANSVKASEENGVPTITFTADFTYRYTPRDGGDTKDGGNRQNVTMVYEDGEWRVASMEHVSAD